MAGRPISSHAYPRIWRHVQELDLLPSSRAIKKLKHSGFKPPYGTQFSNRLIETKISPDQPNLLDYDTAHDLVALISHHRVKRDLSPLSPNAELYNFNVLVTGLGHLTTPRLNEHGDPVEELATKVGVTSDVITQVHSGRLVPLPLAQKIQAFANADTNLVPVQILTGRKGAPCNEPDALASIFRFLEAA